MIARSFCLALIVLVGCATKPDPARATPKSTARTLIQAMADGNKSVVHSCVINDSDQRRVADAVSAATHGAARAVTAMRNRFGEEINRPLGYVDIARLTTDMIDTGEERITGDAATLVTKVVNLEMTHKNDGWRVDIIKSLGGDDKMNKYALLLFTAAGNACAEVAGEIDAGRYATSSDAMEALRSRMGEALAAEHRRIALHMLRDRWFWP